MEASTEDSFLPLIPLRATYHVLESSISQRQIAVCDGGHDFVISSPVFCEFIHSRPQGRNQESQQPLHDILWKFPQIHH